MLSEDIALKLTMTIAPASEAQSQISRFCSWARCKKTPRLVVTVSGGYYFDVCTGVCSTDHASKIIAARVAKEERGPE